MRPKTNASPKEESSPSSAITTTAEHNESSNNNKRRIEVMMSRASLLEEAEEALAHSLLAFLFADLRLLSATGRIYTTFDTLSIDSDLERRSTTAVPLHQVVVDKNEDEDSSLVTTTTNNNNNNGMIIEANNNNNNNNSGITPAQIMAALMLEIREETDRRKAEVQAKAHDAKKKKKHSMVDWEELEGIHQESIFSPQKLHKQKMFHEEDTHTLMRAYNDMIRQDLKKSIRNTSVAAVPHVGGASPHFETTLVDTTSPPKQSAKTTTTTTTTTTNHTIKNEKQHELLETVEDDDEGTTPNESTDQEEHHHVQDDEDDDEQLGPEKTLYHDALQSMPSTADLLSQSNSPASSDDGLLFQTNNNPSSSLLQTTFSSDFSSSEGRLSLAKKNLQDKRQDFISLVEEQREHVRRQRIRITQGEDAAIQDEFEVVGDAFFNEGATLRRNKMTPEQMRKVMERAVKSRKDGELDFLADVFREGTVSQLTAKSNAKIVWINDWYPIKDLTYAISVDEEKKRVLVSFRGCQTQADWQHAYDAKLTRVPNPIAEDYKDKPSKINLYHGFYRYLFRPRKDTGGTTKYDEIANKVHCYGCDRIGPDYELMATGFSLGAALSTLFGLWASTDERFTRNGPVKVCNFGSPKVGGHAFADVFRHQEQCGKLQYARFFNTRDVVAHIPINLIPSKRGSKYVDVGIGIKLPRRFGFCQSHLPEIYYVRKEGILTSYWRALRKNCFLNMPWPWRIKTVHSLNVHQMRLLRAKKRAEKHKDHLVNKSLDELYDALVIKKNKSG